MTPTDANGTAADRLLVVGVRHHSPAAARVVGRLIRERRPAAVLVEGPSDFNDSMSELGLGHEPPIMLYAWAPAPGEAGDLGLRRGAYHPFCAYSPEWVAVTVGLDTGADVRFIDLPWREMVQHTLVENRFAEGESAPPTPRGPDFLQLLGERLGVEERSLVWDELFEIEPDVDDETYLARVGVVEQAVRGGQLDGETRAREDFMVASTLEALDDHPDGLVLVVCGAFHSEAIRAGVRRGRAEGERHTELLERVRSTAPDPADDAFGIALTPTSYAALDALDGYNAGQPSPGFYDAIWRDRQEGRDTTETALRLLGEVRAELRERKQFVAPADLIGAYASARGLAALRGHPVVWRNDLVEGVGSALVKEESEGHPLLAATREALRGSAIGSLAESTRRPPLVREITRRLAELDLEPTARARTVELELTRPEDLERSRLLHCLRVLEVPSAELVQEASLGLIGAPEDDSVTERWQLRWTAEHEAALVMAARHGATLREAIERRLVERVQDETDVAGAIAVLVEALMTDSSSLGARLHSRVAHLLEHSGDIGAVGAGLGALMRLYRYDPVLRTLGRGDLGDLVETAFERTLRLLERMGRQADGSASDPAVEAIRALADTSERVGDSLSLDTAGLCAVLGMQADEQNQAAAVRGAATGALWLVGQDVDLRARVRHVARPEELGEFVAGLTTVAREAVLRQPELVEALDDFVSSAPEPDFLAAAPGLRRAMSGFAPREQALIARRIVQRFGETQNDCATGDSVPLAALDLVVDEDPETLLETARRDAERWSDLAALGVLS